MVILFVLDKDEKYTQLSLIPSSSFILDMMFPSQTVFLGWTKKLKMPNAPKHPLKNSPLPLIFSTDLFIFCLFIKLEGFITDPRFSRIKS